MLIWKRTSQYQRIQYILNGTWGSNRFCYNHNIGTPWLPTQIHNGRKYWSSKRTPKYHLTLYLCYNFIHKSAIRLIKQAQATCRVRYRVKERKYKAQRSTTLTDQRTTTTDEIIYIKYIHLHMFTLLTIQQLSWNFRSQ